MAAFGSLTTDLWTTFSRKSCFCLAKTKLKMTLEVCVVLCFVVLGQATMIVAEDVDDRQSGDNVTAPGGNWNTTQNTTTTTTTLDTPLPKSNSGTVVVVVVICVLACIAVALSVYFFRRKRRDCARSTRMMDKEKKMQIQMSSARNAGVYQDLTVSVPADDRLPASPEHERLKPAEDA